MSPVGQKLRPKLVAGMDTGDCLSEKSFAQMTDLSCLTTLYFTPGRTSVCDQSLPHSTSRMTRVVLQGASMEICVVVAFPLFPLGSGTQAPLV